MSLSTLPLPSISLVLTSNLPYMSTRPSVTDCHQDYFCVADGFRDQDDTQTFESPKKRKQWLHVLRRRRDRRLHRLILPHFSPTLFAGSFLPEQEPSFSTERP
ncbi:hypothetical protein BJ912DRAFT_935272 [Pholiota molesta]|nr:hypothetical protein BJ912DRAFT_935272 [Pholiota molesta]